MTKTEATLYIRVPASLARACKREAEEAGKSLNCWVMRALEQQLHDRNRIAELEAKVLSLGGTLRSAPS